MSVMLITDDLQRVLNQAARRISDTHPLMRSISAQLLSQTQQNFSAQGRPRWKALSAETVKNYQRLGISTAGLLRRSGKLYDSVQHSNTSTSATISAGGGSKARYYARIHQYGGMAGKNRKVKIPARPYLPIDKNKNLQPEAETGIGQVVSAHLRRGFM